MSIDLHIETTTGAEARELDRRSGDGIDVTLLWSPRTDRVWIVVEDALDAKTFEFDVDAGHALEAFHHPYAYAVRRTRLLVAA